MSFTQENLIRELERQLGRQLSADEKRLLLLAQEVTEAGTHNPNEDAKGKAASN